MAWNTATPPRMFPNRTRCRRSTKLLVGYETVVPGFVDALRPIEWRYTNDPAWVMRDKGERLDRNRVWMTAAGEHARGPGRCTPPR